MNAKNKHRIEMMLTGCVYILFILDYFGWQNNSQNKEIIKFILFCGTKEEAQQANSSIFNKHFI